MNWKTPIYFFILLFSVQASQAQYISGVTIPDTSQAVIEDMTLPRVKYASEITAADLENHLTVLASDEFAGRETGEAGIEKAYNYLSNFIDNAGFEAIGVEGSHYQPVSFTFSRFVDPVMYINGERYKHLWEYINFPDNNRHAGEIKASEVMFLGYGIETDGYSDYEGKDVSGKVIMIYEGDPMKMGKSLISGSSKPSKWGRNNLNKLRLAREKGVALVLIIKNDIKGFLAENRRRVMGPSVSLGTVDDEDILLANHAYVSTNIAKAIIGKNNKKFTKVRRCLTKKGKLKKLVLPTDLSLVQDKSNTYLEGNNVMAFVEGTDKKDEVIVVTAHYDHIGQKGDEIFNGADDNGSGTSTVLELAESFLMAKQNGEGPRRSILFMWVTGEEKGLLGSQYYADNPIFEIENTVANVNIDMVGRVDKKYTHNPEYIYVIGSDRLSTDLHKINEKMNDDYSQLILDYTYNDEKDPNRYYYRSDHYNFAAKGIPAIFFFNGTHADYHQPSDTVEKINFDKMEKVGRHIFHLVWELSNRDDRIVVDGEVR